MCLLQRSRRDMLSTEHLGLAWGTVRHGVIASLLTPGPHFQAMSTEPKRLVSTNRTELRIAH
jgi:hypothetical protein